MSSPASHSLRDDARGNRERIVAAARLLFAERGPDVPVTAIARRAGVGVATLYRRFPTKESLLAESYAAEFRACASVVDDALADPDPWRGFCVFLEKMCLMQVGNRGFSIALSGGLSADRDRAIDGFAELVGRAQKAGDLRADFVPGDLAVVVLALCGVASGPSEFAPAAARRLVGFRLAGFRADGPLPAPSALALTDLIPE